jgi:acyl-CoA thioesterase FadM
MPKVYARLAKQAPVLVEHKIVPIEQSDIVPIGITPTNALIDQGISFTSVEELKNPSSHTVPKMVMMAEDLAFKIRTKQPQVFEMEIEVYLKDSNAYGNVYFSRHFEWQGIVREAWFSKRIFANMFELPGVFITKRANIEYLSETYPFQKVKATLNTANFRRASFDIVIAFSNADLGTPISKGSQTIVFADKNKHITKLPAPILEKMKEYDLGTDLA